MAEGIDRGQKRAKKGSTLKRRLACLLLTALGWMPIQQSFAACDPWLARVISAQGQVDVTRIGKAQWRRVARQQTFCVGDQIRVEARSRATIQFHDQTNLTLDAGTTITFSEIEPDKPSLIELIKGAIYFFSRVPHRLNIKTPFISAGMEGTEFVLRVDPNEAALWVFEGRVSFSNAVGSLTLTSGEAAIAQPGKGPMRRTVIKPREAVQWALYYPPIIDHRTSPTDMPRIRDALTHYRHDDLPAAFASLDAVPAASRDARYFTLRAGLLLNIGRVDEARADIDQAIKLDPNNGAAYALQSVIAVTQNEDEQALYLARKAANLDPTSPVSQVALSYAYQAKSDIDKALESTQKAVELAPDDALAYARLSELELSRGDLNRSMKAAEKATSLDPTLARTQSVLGFAYLTRIDIDKAKRTFDKAIELDSAAPLPRLGLGLAKIRDGDLKEGTKEIELAASLDPDNAIVRSYLGKAYFEEKRGGKASTEFAIAKALDPNDPTPYFYDAIHKQTTNRPVEALHDLQKAIELNDNRAVYRSSLLLDQDEAARSAALGRIYNDLGFQQLGLVEGWKSVNTDPSNYSAHRLLADNYAALPRHEIARVSELLQSQLLQPINITPVQPSLGESNLLLLEGSGPSDPSYNEFNPLFTRNRLALQASGVYGSNDTLGDEVTQSGVWNNISYSLGQFHSETDGFRDNNDLEQDIYNVFAQVNLSSELSVQAEYRHREIEHGDLNFNFDLGVFDNLFRRDFRSDTFRIGSRYALASHSDILVSAIYQDVTENKVGDFFGIGVPLQSESSGRGYSVEGQYLFRTPMINTLVGGGYFRANNVIPALNKFNVKSFNAYTYQYIHYPKDFTWILGVSFDSIDDGSLGKFDETNWKAGLIWDITRTTTLRLAATRTLKPFFTNIQTIQPTQVAGFNQFFDDFNATKSKRYGIAIDQKFSPNLYSGLELSRRTLEVPIRFTEEEGSLDENLFRAYINWAPNLRLAANLEYQFEDFEVEKSFQAPDTKTHYLPITVSYFYPIGIFGALNVTYVNQEVANFGPTLGRNDTGNSEFALLNLGLGYRLPKRYGLITFRVSNLLDKDFEFQGFSDRTPDDVESISSLPGLPERTVSAQLTLSF